MGLLHGLFNIEAYEDYRFLCSEFVYYILKESGIVDLKVPRNLVRPQSLLALESNIVFKGNLKDFKQQDCYYTTGESIIMEARVVYE